LHIRHLIGVLALGLVILALGSPHHTPAQINNSEVKEQVAVEVQTPEVPASVPTPPPVEQIVPEEQTPQQAEANVTINPIGCDIYRPLVEQYAWDIRIAMAVMQAESGCNPNASNWRDQHRQCTGSFGLFQLACFWTDNPYDPATNVAKAFEIYSRSGWQPWGAYTNGSYLRYL
jgi:hypothetical protein